MDNNALRRNSFLKLFFTLTCPFLVGAVLMALMGYNPVEAYRELFKGAFWGKFNFGTTLEKWCPIFLTGLAYCVTAKVSYFNLGVEGCLYIGALFSAGAGFLIEGLPWYVHIPLCFLVGVTAGALWALIPGLLRAYLNVNEACSTIMFNYVATLFASYMIMNAWSAKSAASQTVPILKSAALRRIMPPSRANMGIFLAILLFFFICWLLYRSYLGFKIRAVGDNPFFSDYIGIDAKKTVAVATAISGAIGGFAGTIETLGVYGSIIDKFSSGIAFDGLLACLIAKNDLKYLPIYSFMIAALKAGSLGMERFTGVPKALIDTLIPILIILLSIENLFDFTKLIKRSKNTVSQ